MYTFLNAAKNPFKTYVKAGAIGFGVTFVGNFIWTSLDNNAPISIRANPETYVMVLLTKSLYSGLLWPAIPFRILYSPRRFFCLGSGVYDACKAIESFDDDALEKYTKDNRADKCTVEFEDDLLFMFRVVVGYPVIIVIFLLLI